MIYGGGEGRITCQQLIINKLLTTGSVKKNLNRVITMGIFDNRI